jgi:multiple sugar transport system permease protein
MAVIEHPPVMPASAPPARRRARATPKRRDWLAALILLSPACIILGLFHIYPLFYAMWLSTRNITRFGDQGFTALDNYKEIVTSGDLWRTLLNTIWFAAGTVPFEMVISIVVAYLLFQKIRFLSVFRTVYFVPYITSTVAAAAVWLWMFDPQRGVFNTVLGWFHIGPFRWIQEPRGIFELLAAFLHVPWPGWLDGPSLALVSIMLMTIWVYLGFQIVIFLVGLGNVPKDLYEAARVDGASERQLFFGITLPLLTPTIFFIAVVATIGSFQSFNQLYQMTVRANVGGPGGPSGATETVVIKIFNEFSAGQRGYDTGATMSIVLFVIILALTLMQLWLSRRWVRY